MKNIACSKSLVTGDEPHTVTKAMEKTALNSARGPACALAFAVGLGLRTRILRFRMAWRICKAQRAATAIRNNCPTGRRSTGSNRRRLASGGDSKSALAVRGDKQGEPLSALGESGQRGEGRGKTRPWRKDSALLRRRRGAEEEGWGFKLGASSW